MTHRTSRWPVVALVALAVVVAIGSADPHGRSSAGAAVDPGTGAVIGEFVYGVTPARLLDTRPGYNTVDGLFSGSGRLSANTPITLTVGGRGPVPADATSVMLNVAVVDPSAPGFLSVWPSGTWPGTSNLNYVAGSVVPNSVFSGLSGGTLRIMASGGSPHVVVDVMGYLSDQPAA